MASKLKLVPSRLVVTLVHGERLQYRMICQSLPNQLTHFIAPQRMDLLIVLASDEIKREELEQSLQLPGSRRRQPYHNLDATVMDVFLYAYKNSTSTIFIAPNYKIPFPHYIQQDPTLLQQPQHDAANCNSTPQYIQSTRWYSNEMLHLGILRRYDYFVKLDVDVIFTRTLDILLLHDMRLRGAVFGHTAQYQHLYTSCSTNITRAVRDFVENAKQQQDGADVTEWKRVFAA